MLYPIKRENDKFYLLILLTHKGGDEPNTILTLNLPQ